MHFEGFFATETQDLLFPLKLNQDKRKAIFFHSSFHTLQPYLLTFHYFACEPPSTIKIFPVTKSDAFEARKTAAPFKSSSLPNLFSGVESKIGFFPCSRTPFVIFVG